MIELNDLRYELKYLIQKPDILTLEQRFKHVMQRDSHAADDGYFIRSLYFDDIENSSYHQKMNGQMRRVKYRIRYYDFDDSAIFFEKKIKENNKIAKQSFMITRDEVDTLLNREPRFLLKKGDLGVDVYRRWTEKALRPKMIVDYRRMPYTYPAGNVRITFDTGLHMSEVVDGMFDERSAMIPVMNDQGAIMEVKYGQFIPAHIKDLLALDNSVRMAISKYTMCREINL